MTPDEMAKCAAGGEFWYMRPDGTFYGRPEQVAANEGDTYLLDASDEWVAQWESWDQAVEAMAPLFAALNEFRN